MKTYAILDIERKEKLALVKQICRVCEKQYRKGYKHGFEHCKNDLVTEDEVLNFRVMGIDQGYSTVINPPEFERKENPVGRILAELGMRDMEMLRMLLAEFDKGAHQVNEIWT